MIVNLQRKTLHHNFKKNALRVVLHFCNSITQEAEARESRVQGQPEQASKPGSTQQELKIQLSPNALAQHAQDTGLDLLMAQTNK